MAKKAYIGVDGVARKVKKGYIGIENAEIWVDDTANAGDLAGSPFFEFEGNSSFAYDAWNESSVNVVLNGVAYEGTVYWVDEYSSDNGVMIETQNFTIDVRPDNTYEIYDPDGFLTDCQTASLKVYTGSLDGVARKIKKAYIGIGGVARPCWSGGELAYYGQIAALSKERAPAAASVGDYAVFAGGSWYPSGINYPTTNTDAYNSSLVRTTRTALGYTRESHVATSVGNYAIFAGGRGMVDGAYAVCPWVEAYNSALTKSTHDNLCQSRTALSATSVGTYAIFVVFNSPSGFSKYVDFYDTSLTRTQYNQSLANARHSMCATTLNDFAIFGGGTGAANYTTVDAYHSSLTHITLTDMTYSRYRGAATTVGDYALFGGGNSSTAVLDVYDGSGTKTNNASLSATRIWMATAKIGQYAMFAGGNPDTTVIDVFDTSLTRTNDVTLSVARWQLAGATVGNYALFAGGAGATGVFATVDAYTIA